MGKEAKGRTLMSIANKIDADLKPLKCGDEVLYPPLVVGGKAFHFDAPRIRFLYALQKSGGDLDVASEMAGVSIDFAKRFISSKKFKNFRREKLEVMAARSGDFIEEWWRIGVKGMRGKESWWEGRCVTCQEMNTYTLQEIETYRNDEMALEVKCKLCLQPVEASLREEPYEPTREMVQYWDSLGARLVPKVERVHHEFSNETFEFVPQEEIQ